MVQYDYKVDFFEDKRGNSPVEDFLDTLPQKVEDKTYKLLLLLEEKGPMLHGQYLKKLKYHSNLYQVQFQHGKNYYRILCTRAGNTYICLHMISKKTNDTPMSDIKVALKRMSECMEE